MTSPPALKPGEWPGEILRTALGWLLALLVTGPALVIYAADRLTSCIIRKRGGLD